MRNDYEKLQGKEITCIGEDGKCVAIVSGIDYDIGISIQNKTYGNYLLCINSPRVAELRKLTKTRKNLKWKTWFCYVANKIRKGTIDLTKAIEFFDSVNKNGSIRRTPTEENCPFT